MELHVIYSGINLTKDVQNAYTENYILLLRDIEVNINKLKIQTVYELEDLVLTY